MWCTLHDLASTFTVCHTGSWLPERGGSQAVPDLQQVVGVPHILRLLRHQSHLAGDVQAINKPAPDYHNVKLATVTMECI